MAGIQTNGLHHLRLTVTDLERSRAFYRDVLSFTIVAQSPGSPADPAVRSDPDQLYGGVVFAAGGMLLGLRPVADAGDRFKPTRADLEHAADRLAHQRIEHGEIRDLPAFGIAILSFTDPDGIHLELTAPL